MVQESTINKPKILVIAGPTGVGKTEIAMKLYDILYCELISADSMQIYKECNIATAKLENNLLTKYPHQNVNIKHIYEEYSTAEFKEDTIKIIDNAKLLNKLPIIVGGTGLYIESLLFPYNFANCPKDASYRKELVALMNEKGKDILYNKLCEVDEISAQKININDTKKIIRALEIYHTTKLKPSSYYNNTSAFENSPYDYQIIFVNNERDKLYQTINKRVDLMIKKGLVEEAKYVYDLQKQLNRTLQASSAIGYKEFFDYFEDKITLDRAIELVKQHTRNYAKRQITWYKRYTKNIIFMNNQSNDDKDKIVNYITDKYTEYLKNTKIEYTK